MSAFGCRRSVAPHWPFCSPRWCNKNREVTMSVVFVQSRRHSSSWPVAGATESGLFAQMSICICTGGRHRPPIGDRHSAVVAIDTVVVKCADNVLHDEFSRLTTLFVHTTALADNCVKHACASAYKCGHVFAHVLLCRHFTMRLGTSSAIVRQLGRLATGHHRASAESPMVSGG